ncbi:MAG: 3-hydroxyacyl-CoA dehydrogenase NAD-binding domain-containing protein [Pseudomonadota bacterium]
MSDALKIGVCGSGAMGSGIAQVAAQAGCTVVVYDTFEPSREKSQSGITKDLAKSVERGRLTQDAADAVRASLSWTGDVAGLAGCDLVIEAIIEQFDVKQGLFSQLEEVLAADAVIASNTSSLPIGRLAKGLKHPERFLGMHFFNPATAMKLVEVISGPATPPALAGRIAGIAKAWGKVAVPVADVPGFIVNRVARPFYGEAFRARQEGVAAEVIDHLFKAAAGFRMGPLELTDLIGQDVNFAVASSVWQSYFGQTRFVPQLGQAALVDAGWLGRKTGRGVYDYAAGQGPAAPAQVPAEPLAGAPARPEAPSPALAPIEVGGVLVRFTRGRTARAEAAEAGKPVALLDWFDGATATAAGFAVSGDEAAVAAAALLAAWGLQPFRLADRPGLIVTRTLAQIANAAGDAVHERVSDREGIDSALRFGANYPFGPFAWSGMIGTDALVGTLTAIAATTGQPMYNPSEYWSAQP